VAIIIALTEYTDQMTKVDNWLRSAEKTLVQSGIGTARLDCLVLLEDIMSKDRSWLLAHPEFELTTKQSTKLKNLLSQRAQHIPLAYVRGQTEFYGRTFVVNNSVLEPRPESETMIDMLKKVDFNTLKDVKSSGKLEQIKLADVGTGSGALGITAKLECPDLDVELLEIDKEALKVAKTNVDLFTLNISAIESDLLSASSSDLDVLLCNLPYVPDNFQINTAAGHEPNIAIFGGPDGLDVYRRLFDQIKKRSIQPLLILNEAMPPQHDTLESIANSSGYNLIDRQDFIQVFERTGK
jgi:release factor glutamine methyltransferase